MSRLRASEAMRRLTCEVALATDDLILPLFVVPGRGRRESVASLPDVARLSVDLLPAEVESLTIPAVLLFGVPDPPQRDRNATASTSEENLVGSAIKAIKQARPDLLVVTDVCLCAYTDHGHCGLLNDAGSVDNDASLNVLARMAVTHAAAGADVVAPSAMLDGQVAAIREQLDAAAFSHVAIMSYAAKFASAFYGPFRDVAASAPSNGDRRGQQLPPPNAQEALRDALADEQEGADWLMVKPALPYLDILQTLHTQTSLPVAAYQVSGEYAMLKHAASNGAIDERAGLLESLTAIKRAGANAIITYAAREVAHWLKC